MSILTSGNLYNSYVYTSVAAPSVRFSGLYIASVKAKISPGRANTFILVMSVSKRQSRVYVVQVISVFCSLAQVVYIYFLMPRITEMPLEFSWKVRVYISWILM